MDWTHLLVSVSNCGFICAVTANLFISVDEGINLGLSSTLGFQFQSLVGTFLYNCEFFQFYVSRIPFSAGLSSLISAPCCDKFCWFTIGMLGYQTSDEFPLISHCIVVLLNFSLLDILLRDSNLNTLQVRGKRGGVTAYELYI